MSKPTAKQRREWQARVTAMPTRADIDRCKELWPEDWESKNAFCAGQVATLLAEVDRLHAALAAKEARAAARLEIVTAVAKGPLSWDVERGHICVHCDQVWDDGDPDDDEPGHIEHTADCPVTQARALLASADVTAPGCRRGNM